MAVTFRPLLVLLAALAAQVMGQCTSYGIDYANGGQYYIDASLDEYFSFVTVFQGEFYGRDADDWDPSGRHCISLFDII